MNITEMYITNRVNRPRIKMSPRYLIIHWTANTGKGANARANRNYFQFTKRPASAHFIVDDREIVQCLPENEVAYHIGARQYFHPEARNSNSIGIEMCVNADGNFAKMRENTVKLAADICKRWGIDPMTHMLRHWDVTRKDCPRFFVEDVAAWEQFKRDVAREMAPAEPKEAPKVEKTDWKREIHDTALRNRIITSDHSDTLDAPASKWFVLAVVLNAIKFLGGKLK